MRHRNRAGGVWRVCRGPKEEPSREPASEGMRRMSFGAETTVSFQLLTPKVWTHAKHQFPLLTDLTEVFGYNSRESPNLLFAESRGITRKDSFSLLGEPELCRDGRGCAKRDVHMDGFLTVTCPKEYCVSTKCEQARHSRRHSSPNETQPPRLRAPR